MHIDFNIHIDFKLTQVCNIVFNNMTEVYTKREW